MYMKPITPQIDEKQLKVVQTKVGRTSDMIMALKIEGDADMTVAADLLSKANRYNDEITKDKEKLTKPLNAVLKLIRAKYKPIETELEKAIKHLRKEIGTYQTKRDAEAEAERARIAKRVGEGKGKLKLETAGRQMAAVDTPDTVVATDAGSISFRDDYEITIVSIKEIPEEFLSVDEAAIKRAIKAGREVAGVVATKVKVPVNRRA